LLHVRQRPTELNDLRRPSERGGGRELCNVAFGIDDMHTIENEALCRRTEEHVANAAAIEELALRLKRDVSVLATDIGERNLRDPARRHALQAAREYIVTELTAAGHTVNRQAYTVGDTAVENLEIEIRGVGKPDQIIVIGAHYDTAPKTPGANDNASGVAALLAIAQKGMIGSTSRRTIRLVAFCTEEPPYTRTAVMGSRVYARACRRQNDAIVAMLSLEMLGCYDESRGGKHAPLPLRLAAPWRANFLAVVGNLGSRELVARVVAAFEEDHLLPCKGAALPGVLPGVRSSDHWSFWKEGYRAVMLTDTAWLRYRHYHRPSDTPDKLDFRRLAKAASGVTRALDRLANA
jgi:Zn-dependent M28 family amino/carboxypeptidase